MHCGRFAFCFGSRFGGFLFCPTHYGDAIDSQAYPQNVDAHVVMLRAIAQP
jgi:hypothetical protein